MKLNHGEKAIWTLFIIPLSKPNIKMEDKNVSGRHITKKQKKLKKKILGKD